MMRKRDCMRKDQKVIPRTGLTQSLSLPVWMLIILQTLNSERLNDPDRVKLGTVAFISASASFKVVQIG